MSQHPWHDVELPNELNGAIPAIIEIPKGSKVKYEIDKRTGLLTVDRILFSAVHYPANYGFIPRTYCDDGDALDVLVLCQEPIESLAVMRAKVIGVMKMRDDKGIDDKLIAVHADDPEYAAYDELTELPRHRLLELKRFFQDYKVLEKKRVLVSDPLGRAEALQVLRDAIALYNRERDRLLVDYPPVSPAVLTPRARPKSNAAKRVPAKRPVTRASTKRSPSRAQRPTRKKPRA